MNGKLYIKGKTAGDFAYMDRSDITAVHLKEGICRIGDMAFCRCSSLKSVHLPKSLDVVGINAFVGTNITTLNIPDNVVFIDSKAFAFNHKLRSVRIGKNVEFIMPGAFAGCPMLKEITVDPENLYYYVDNGCLIEKKTKKLIAATYPYKIPEGVEIIDRQIFLFLTNCNTVTLPSSVKAIYMHEGEVGNFYMCKEIANAGGTVTIKAPKDSYAEKFARKHEINFEEDKE